MLQGIKKGWNMLPTPVKWIVGIGGSVLVYKEGKKLLNRPDKGKLPQGGAGMPVVSYSPDGKPVFWNPAPLAKELHDTMAGLGFFTSGKDAAWQKFADLPTDDMAVACYNYFNSNYGDGTTLTAWINDEWASTAAKTAALSRLSVLGLK